MHNTQNGNEEENIHDDDNPDLLDEDAAEDPFDRMLSPEENAENDENNEEEKQPNDSSFNVTNNMQENDEEQENIKDQSKQILQMPMLELVGMMKQQSSIIQIWQDSTKMIMKQ